METNKKEDEHKIKYTYRNKHQNKGGVKIITYIKTIK